MILIKLLTFSFKYAIYLFTLFLKEMLSRSSLETQKLELMSAMSELKLQQAALERENLELRTTYFNNNSIPAERRPPVSGGCGGSSAGRVRTNSTSALHSSHNSLQNNSGTIPKVCNIFLSLSSSSSYTINIIVINVNYALVYGLCIYGRIMSQRVSQFKNFLMPEGH